MKIDFYSTQHENKTSIDTFNKITNSTTNFKNVLDRQIDNMGEAPNIDDNKNNPAEEPISSNEERIENSAKPGSEKSKSADSKVDNDDKDTIAQNIKEKSNSIIENDNKTEISSEGIGLSIDLNLDMLNILQNMLKDLSVDAREIKNIKEVLQGLKDSLMGRDIKDTHIQKNIFDNLIKLRSFLNMLNNEEPLSREQIKIDSKFLQFKDIIKQLNNSIQKHLSKSNDNTLPSTMESKPIETIGLINEKIQFFSKATNNNESAPSDNNDSNSAFHFFRNHSNISKGSASALNLPKNNNFNEQLQNIIQNARIYIRDNKNGKFSIRLYPESLGRVNVNLGLDQGMISGRFLAETAEARNLLLENIYLIKEKLQEAGMSVGEFQVNVKNENKSWEWHARGEDFSINIDPNINLQNGYETISRYIHHGEIDMII
ncbi:MAG: flagellar hook-length control protein FliK [Spirochaetota bacterium]|nr:flagellar hook-length control protein FliK [Spirochaetota bacterium]